MPNHPPAPVLESVNPGTGGDKCEQLKAEFGIETRKHRKGAPKSSGMESHHVFQDAAMGDVSTYSGWAVLLGGAPNGEHDIVNAEQIATNCPSGSAGGAGPSTFGALKAASEAHLTKGLTGANRNGKTISPQQAAELAKCLVEEAERETKKYMEKKGKDLNDDTPVDPVAGCLAPHTLVWMSDFVQVPVEDLQPGMRLEGHTTEHTIARVGRCFGPVVEIDLGNDRISLAPYHRVRLENEAYIRAGWLQPGHRLKTASGSARVESVHVEHRSQHLYRFVFVQRGACRIGRSGLWIEVAGGAVPSVTAHIAQPEVEFVS